MATSIFKLFGEIFVDNKEANKNIEQTGKAADKTSGKFSAMAQKAIKMGKSVASAAGSAASSLFNIASESAESLDTIQKESRKLGLSYGTYQKLAYVANRSGASIDNFGKGMRNLTATLGEVDKGNLEAAETYEKLGVEIYDAEGNLRSTEDIMQDTILALADMENATDRNITAQQIFGNGYTELIPLMENGSQGIQDLMQSAEDLGIVMSDDAVDAGADFKDAYDDITDTIKALGTEIGGELLPIAVDMLTWVRDNIPEIKQFIKDLYDNTKRWIGNIKDAFISAWETVEPYIPVIKETFRDMFSSAASFWNDKLKPALLSMKSFFENVLLPAIQAVADAISPIVKGIFDLLSGTVGNVIEAFQGLIDFWTGVFTLDWEKAWDGICEVVDAAVNQILDDLNFVKNAWDWITDFLGFTDSEKEAEFEAFSKSVTHNVSVTSGGSTHASTSGSLFPEEAEGGITARAGATIVGEDGLELLELPTGAKVTPLNDNNNAFYDMGQKLDAMIELLKASTSQKMGVYINGNALVGQIASDIDETLGVYAAAAARGV